MLPLPPLRFVSITLRQCDTAASAAWGMCGSATPALQQQCVDVKR